MKKLTQEQREIVTKYGYLFVSTGGNDIIELVERDGVNYFNNPVVAELQGSCYSQIQLLLKLRDAGLLASEHAAEQEPTSPNQEHRQALVDPGLENTSIPAETRENTGIQGGDGQQTAESNRDILAAELRAALAWGMTYGPVIPSHQWDEMREGQIAGALARIGVPTQQAAEPVDMVLVPLNPTPEQIKAGDRAAWPYPCAQIYKTMLDAAPTQQQAQPNRTGCTAGSDEECTNRRCATNCPALPQKAAEPEGQQHKMIADAKSALNEATTHLRNGDSLGASLALQAVEKLFDTLSAPTQQPLLSHADELTAMERYIEMITQDRDSAHDFLTRAGIIDSNGNLSEQYRDIVETETRHRHNRGEL